MQKRSRTFTLNKIRMSFKVFYNRYFFFIIYGVETRFVCILILGFVSTAGVVNCGQEKFKVKVI